MEKISLEKSFAEGIKDAAPTALGYISIGLAFGVVAYASGLSWLEAGLMSLLVYGGAAQFAMVAMMVSHDPILSVAATCFLVNLRNMLMTLHATTIFTQSSLLENMAIGSLMTDESYGVMLNEQLHNDTITTQWMHGNNLTGYVAWFLATVVGALLGSMIPNPEIFGLDFTLMAMFIGIFASQLEAILMSRTVKKIGLILLAITLSFLVLTLLLPQSAAVLLATLIGCATGVSLDAK